MITVNENEVLGYCYKSSGDTGALVLNKIGPEGATALRAALCEFLYEEARRNDKFISIQEVEVAGLKDFKSILVRGKASGKTTKIIAFNFHSAIIETMLPLLGITISLIVGAAGPGTIPQVGGILKTLWGKLSVLKVPGDEDPILVLEALLSAKAKNIANGHDANPSTRQIEDEALLDPQVFNRALARLKTMGIIEAKQWAGQKEDMTNPDNKWKVSF